MPRTHLIYLESNIIFNAALTKFKYHQSPSKCDENNARRIYQAYIIKNNNCSLSEKKNLLTRITSLAGTNDRAGPVRVSGVRSIFFIPAPAQIHPEPVQLTVHRSDDAPCSRRVIIASCPKIDIRPCPPRLKILNIKHTLDSDSDILLDWTQFILRFSIKKLPFLAEKGCIEQTFLIMTNRC